MCDSNGQLREYFAAGMSKNEFWGRMKVVLQPVAATTALPAEGPRDQTGPPSADQRQETPEPPEMTRQSSNTSALVADNRTRAAAQRKEQDEKAKADRIEKARKQNKGKENARNAPEEPKKAVDTTYALEQKKRQQDAKNERARILKLVEDDKAERKAREVRRKAQASMSTENSATEQFISKLSGSSSSKRTPECALQIRLFDGATIRSRFPSTGTLRNDVRKWVDEQESIGETPYSFKQTYPNKNISISDEKQSLLSLDLTPSATLILVPVREYTSAYDNSDAGIVSKGVSTGYGLISSGIGMVTGIMGSLLGGAAALPPASQDPPASTPDPSINMRTLRDSERTDDREFYNGNAVSRQMLWIPAVY